MQIKKAHQQNILYIVGAPKRVANEPQNLGFPVDLPMGIPNEFNLMIKSIHDIELGRWIGMLHTESSNCV